MARARRYDVIVLDVMLPARRRRGLPAAARARRLDAGADAHRARRRRDRVAASTAAPTTTSLKPFSFAELLARLRALARRGAGRAADRARGGDLRLDPATRRVWRGDDEIGCRRRSSRCSRRSCGGRARCSSRLQLLERAWDRRTRTGRTSSTCTSATCARRSTGRSASSRSRPCAASATDCARAADAEAVPIRLRLAARLRAVDGDLLAALGALVYFRVDGALSEVGRPGAAAVGGSARPPGRGLAARRRRDSRGVAQVVAADGRIVRSEPASLPAAAHPDALAARTACAMFERRSPSAPANSTLSRAGRSRRRRKCSWSARPSDSGGDAQPCASRADRAGPGRTTSRYARGLSARGRGARPVESMRRRASAISATSPAPGSRCRPVATRSRLAITLNEMLARLEAALEHERRFVADASHELRTPLALLKAELEPRTAPPDARRAPAAVGSAPRRPIGSPSSRMPVPHARPDQERSGSGSSPSPSMSWRARPRPIRGARRRGSTDGSRSSPPGTEAQRTRLRLEQALRNLVATRSNGEGRDRHARAVGEATELHAATRAGVSRQGRQRAFDGSRGATTRRAVEAAWARDRRGDRAAHGGTAGIAATDGADVWIRSRPVRCPDSLIAVSSRVPKLTVEPVVWTKRHRGAGRSSGSDGCAARGAGLSARLHGVPRAQRSTRLDRTKDGERPTSPPLRAHTFFDHAPTDSHSTTARRPPPPPVAQTMSPSSPSRRDVVGRFRAMDRGAPVVPTANVDARPWLSSASSRMEGCSADSDPKASWLDSTLGLERRLWSGRSSSPRRSCHRGRARDRGSFRSDTRPQSSGSATTDRSRRWATHSVAPAARRRRRRLAHDVVDRSAGAAPCPRGANSTWAGSRRAWPSTHRSGSQGLGMRRRS